MQIRLKLENLPVPIKNILRFMKNKIPFLDKYKSELSFWKSRYEIDNRKFFNFHYQKIMLAMAGEKNDNFLSGKLIADFGCGPRGSLVWAKSASLCIGIDVLADRYAEEFYDNIISHNMIYIKSTEKVIPLPSNFLDIIFTLNAIDHVDSFPVICNEILRVLKPGGEFIGSFNLEEPVTPCEPQKLNEILIKEHLLKYLKIQIYRISEPGPEDNKYLPFFNNSESYKKGKKGYLWIRGKKI